MLTVRALVGESRRRRRAVERRAEIRRKVAATAQAARATKAMPDWEGWRSLRVVAVVDEAVDTKSYYFSPTDNRPLTPFAPGQYLTFRLHPPAGSEPIVRCYSLSDHPHEDYYRCTVKLIQPPRDRPDLPPGRGSSCFHEHVHVGDVVEARAPAGTFFVNTASNEPVVLVGAGIGLTPLMSMLGAALESGRRRQIYVLLGFRNSCEHPLKQHLVSLAAEHPNVHLHVSYSNPLPEDTFYKDYNHDGRVTIERIREVLPSNNFHFYLCGPGAMMESLVPALLAWGVPESHIHYEAFGPASVKKSNSAPATTPCEVRFARSDRTATWNGSQATLLEFGEAAGLRLPSGCRAGSCGECMTTLKSGNVAMLREPSITVPPSQCLICISVPDGPIVLDA